MSSGAGRFPHPHLWAYGVSKAGICFLAETAAEELGPLGIRVNAVAPGIIDDELMSFITAGGPLLDDYLAQMPLGRVGTVEDVAAAVRYLLGPESSFVTGEVARRGRRPPPASGRRLLPAVRRLRGLSTAARKGPGTDLGGRIRSRSGWPTGHANAAVLPRTLRDRSATPLRLPGLSEMITVMVVMRTLVLEIARKTCLGTAASAVAMTLGAAIGASR